MGTIQKEKRALLGAHILGLLFYTMVPIVAQVSFQPLNSETINNANSGVCLAAGDINGDGLDDIARFDQAERLQLLLQLPSGHYKLHFESNSIGNRQWNILLYDLNHDGWAEVISGGSNEINYWISDADGIYNHLKDGRSSFLPQAANLTDIDQDGIPDLFICNDIGESLSLKGAQTFPWDRRSFIDFDFPNEDDFAGNYGSVWQDINGDGREDLYISKCFQTATSPEDPRRINQLFLSEGDTAFTEKAVQWGVADSAQSWASTFADVDNDGDWDLLVLNHDAPSALYYNRGDHFEKSIDFAGGPIESTAVQVIAIDFNCDAWIDFLITGRETELLINQGDGTFLRMNSALGIFRHDISTASSGDLNNDGYPDIMIARHDLYNAPGDKPDRLLLNQGGDRHFFKLELMEESGITSGLGAVCKLYTEGLMQMRSLRVGDSYGISNSNIFHFGLGTIDRIDSIIVLWADGQVNKMYGAAANKTYILNKGSGFQGFQSFAVDQYYLCENDTVLLEIPDTLDDPVIYHYESNSWDSSYQTEITEAGNYFWQAFNNGNVVKGEAIYIPFDPVPPLEVKWDSDPTRCHLQTANLQVDSSTFIQWNDGWHEPQRWIDTSGDYFAQMQGACGQYFSDTVSIEFYPSVNVEARGDTVYTGGDAVLNAEGMQNAWYDSDTGAQLLHFGDQFSFSGLQKDTTLWVAAFDVFEFSDTNKLGEFAHLGNNKYNNPFIDGALIFRTFQDCALISVKVQTEIPGKRGIQLIRDRKLLRVDTFYLDSGITELFLNWSLKAGQNYTIKTDRGINFSEFQSFSPQLFRTISSESVDLVDYPYSDGEFIEITGSNYSREEYFYFYEWKVKASPDTCYSERVPVTAVVRDTTSLTDPVQPDLQLFPNPVSQSFRVSGLPGFQKGQLQLFSSHGQMVRKWENADGDREFSVAGLADGWYIVRFYYDGKVKVGRLLKVETH